MTGAGPKQEPDRLSARTAARLAAVQALYQMELAGTDLNEVIDEFLRLRLSATKQDTSGPVEAVEEAGAEGADRVFFAEILRAVLRRQREIDPLIDHQLATGWRLVRVDAILRAILRAGVSELVDRVDVPARVVINEYINVAHFFFSEDEPRVVNGILDKIARQVRAREFEGKRGEA